MFEYKFDGRMYFIKCGASCNCTCMSSTRSALGDISGRTFDKAHTKYILMTGHNEIGFSMCARVDNDGTK